MKNGAVKTYLIQLMNTIYEFGESDSDREALAHACAKALIEQEWEKYDVNMGAHGTCLVCGKDYELVRTHRSRKFCPDCYNHNNRTTFIKVKEHLRRTNNAQLTLRQWIKTLQYFDYKCAYCGADYDSIEHYIPIELGGSTSVENCLPACRSCNGVKKNRHPDAIEWKYPERIIAAKRYLDSVSSDDNAALTTAA